MRAHPQIACMSESTKRKPVILLLHHLGGSAQEWRGVVAAIGDGFECIAVDLPGFGDASTMPGYTVAEMVERVAAVIRAEALSEWMIVGHSMGAKVATTLARRAEDGEAGLEGLFGLVLVAGSPPCPEPMDETRRAAMLNWFQGDAQANTAEAREFIDQNVSGPLDAADYAQAVADVLRANRDAWVAWLETASKEDWSSRVGVLRIPALLIAGAEDGDLGLEAQSRLMARHFSNVKLVTIPDAMHLLPLENPNEVARLILNHALMRGNVSEDYLALIDSDRVGVKTREALLARGKPDDAGYRPQAISEMALEIMRAVIDRILPGHRAFINIAARIDARLASGSGDGWRRAELPADAQAFADGCSALQAASIMRFGRAFAQLATCEQDAILSDVSGGTCAAGVFDARQMKYWFADLRAEAVRLYVAHPATLDRMGYSGIANGGDGLPKTGFVRVGTDEHEDWEPDNHA